ncbi:MAG: hypothetical protein AB1777_05840 [Bacteroidota bacterium]
MNIKIGFILLAIGLLSCSKPQPKNVIIDLKGKEQTLTLIADSIKYEVVVQATDGDIWEAERLKGYTNHRELVEGVFKNVINGKLKAYDYATDEPLTVEELRKLIDDQKIDASQVGKLLFTERWYIDPNGHIYKFITSVTLGKAEYSKQGTFKGYSALFKVKY